MFGHGTNEFDHVSVVCARWEQLQDLKSSFFAREISSLNTLKSKFSPFIGDLIRNNINKQAKIIKFLSTVFNEIVGKFFINLIQR